MAVANPLKQKLASGETVLGAFSIIPSPEVVEILAQGGLDFLVLDMEHGTFHPASVEACIRACEAAGASALVRIPGLNLSAAQWALDSGAHGIVVPQVDGAREAQAAMELAKFPPMGRRGYNPFVRAADYSGTRSAPGKLDNAFPLTTVIVETQKSVDELDKICAIRDLDVIYMGVYDLSVALGFDGDVAHPVIQEIVKKSVAKIRAAGKGAGLMVRSPDEMKSVMALGANVLLCGVDTYLIRDSVRQSVAALSAARLRKAS